MTKKNVSFETINLLDQASKIYALLAEQIILKRIDNKIKVFFNKNFDPVKKEKNIQFIKSNETYLKKLLEENNDVISPSTFIIKFPDYLENPLSYAQERLWFIERYEEGSASYNMPMLYRMSGEANVALLDLSIRAILMRHDILRTVIRQDDNGYGYQQVLKFSEDLYHFQKVKVDNQTDLKSILAKESNNVFDLANEYPIRFCFYELHHPSGQKENYISIVVHHIAFDAWSVDIFWQEIHAYYEYYAQQKQGMHATLHLPALGVQYKDFALWQRNFLSGERLEKQRAYWRHQLMDYHTLNLRIDKPRPLQINYTGKDVCFQLENNTSHALRLLAKELKVSLYSLLLSAFYLMLRAYTNQNDLIIGTPVSNRHYEQIEHLIGFFINSLALRVQVDEKQAITDFIKSVSEVVIDAQAHQDLPFEKLVEELKIEQDTSRHPLFQVMFGLDSVGEKTTGLLEQYIKEYDIHNVAKFDLSVFVDDSQDCLSGVFNYAVSLFEEHTIEGFAKTYQAILNQFADLSTTKKCFCIHQLNYLSQEQYEQTVYAWNGTEMPYPADETIIGLFEKQANKTPDAIAVIYEDIKLTYTTLNQKANQLAHYLRKTYAIIPDDPIGLCLERSEQMLIAILGVLKAGGCYVPIDPYYPDERIKYILNDTKTKVVLVNESHQQKIMKGLENTDVLILDSALMQKTLSDISANNPSALINPKSLAYIIYTSGTTGNPKGAMLEHQGVINRIHWMNQTYPLTERDRILQKTPYVFDVSVWELFWAHWYGASIVFARPDGHKDANYIQDLISRECVTITHFVPSMLTVFQETLEPQSPALSTLRYIFCSGEALSLEQVQKCHRLLPWVSVHNLYGPTEASIDVLSYDCSYPDIKAIYIGKPIANTTAYV